MEIEKSLPYGEGGADAILNVQPNTSISIAYHQLFGPHDDLMLLELDEKLLPDILNQRYVVVLFSEVLQFVFFVYLDCVEFILIL